jgi:hypothetical protein
MAISSSLILVIELPDDGGFTKDAGVALVWPLIVMLALMNKMSWVTFARGKNVRCDYDLKIKLNVVIGVARIIHLYVRRHDTGMREEGGNDEMEDPMGGLLIKGMTS